MSSSVFANIPLSLMVASVVLLLAFSYATLAERDVDDPRYLPTALLGSYSLVCILSICFGLLALTVSDASPLKKHAQWIFPLFIVTAIWLKFIITSMSQYRTKCAAAYEKNTGKPPVSSQVYTSVIFLNSIKPVLSMLAAYVAFAYVPALATPIFEALNTSHPVAYYLAGGFWIACALLPAETSAYFGLQQSGCLPAASIDLATVNQDVQEEEDQVYTDDTFE